MHEKGKAHIFVSGSSARLLSKELGSALTGRHVDIHVNPLTFIEFLYFNDLKINTKFELLSNKLKIKQMLREYLASGGFPGVVMSGEKNEQLTRYFEDIIYREKIDSAIQVCYSLTGENRERELGGLLEAMEEFDLGEGLIITEEIEGEEKYNGKCIKFIPLWKWLFEIQDKA